MFKFRGRLVQVTPESKCRSSLFSSVFVYFKKERFICKLVISAASAKRSHENSSSGNDGVGKDQNLQKQNVEARNKMVSSCLYICFFC